MAFNDVAIKDMVRMTTRYPPDLHERISERAGRRGRSIQAEVVLLLEQGLAAAERADRAEQETAPVSPVVVDEASLQAIVGRVVHETADQILMALVIAMSKTQGGVPSEMMLELLQRHRGTADDAPASGKR